MVACCSNAPAISGRPFFAVVHPWDAVHVEEPCRSAYADIYCSIGGGGGAPDVLNSTTPAFLVSTPPTVVSASDLTFTTTPVDAVERVNVTEPVLATPGSVNAPPAVVVAEIDVPCTLTR